MRQYWLLCLSLVLLSVQLQGQNGWSLKAYMPTARVGATAAVVGDKIYVIGGDNSYAEFATNEVYDPATDSWQTLNPMPTARTFPFFGVVRDTIYVMGGAYANYAVTTAKVEAYDPVTDAWISKSDLSLPRLGSNAAVVHDTIFLVAGSFNRAECQAYYPVQNCCQVKSPIPLSLGQKGGLSVTAHNGIVYAFGGSYYPPWSAMARVSAYDPQSDTWASRSPMPTPRFGFQTYLVGEKIYAIGGSQVTNTALATVEVYDPIADSWESLPPMPRALAFPSGAVVNGRIYVIGGTTDWVAKSVEVWELDPLATDVEEAMTPKRFALFQNYPNPFNPSTEIRFQIADASHVQLVVYDLLGREVVRLVDEEKKPGVHAVQFSASGLASGTYLYRLTAGEYSECRRMVLVR